VKVYFLVEIKQSSDNLDLKLTPDILFIWS
jgi:hypothetical protein